MVLQRDSPNLDILRSFAVVAVLVNHLAQMTPWGRDGGAWALDAVGRAGVLIFFVHTALVLMGSLERLEARGGDTHLRRACCKQQPGNALRDGLARPAELLCCVDQASLGCQAFYVQRFFRLYPLSVSCVTAVLLVHFAAPGLRLPWVSFKAIAANLALVQNLTWDPSAIWPLWSLPYEVQMYAVLPFIYLLTKRRGALAYLALLWAIAAMLGRYLFAADPRYLVVPYEYPFPWFVPVFLGGVFAFVLLRRTRARIPAVLWPVTIVGIFFAFQLFPTRRSELAMTLLGFAIPQFREMQNRVIKAMAHQVAKYSYGIYLIHAPVLELCFVHLRRLGMAERSGLFIVLLVVCPVIAYHLIEKPMIDLGHKLSRRIVRKSEKREAVGAVAGVV